MVSPKGHKPYPGGERGGRPIKYTPEYLINEAEALEEWMKEKDNLFIEEFCLERDYHDSRIEQFCRDSERFSLAYSKFKMKQKKELFKGGLKRKFAHPMCALILSHNHGVYQKTEQKVSGDIENPLSFIITNLDGNTKDLVDDE